jgi:outer membrane protein W
MTRNTHRTSIALLMTAVMVAALCASADDNAGTVESAEAISPKVRKWHLRFGALLADTNGSSPVTAQPGYVTAGIDAGGGGCVSLERRVSPLVGIEFGLAATGLNVNVSAGVGGKSAFTSTEVLVMAPLTLGANFHIVNDGPIDVYAGPLLTYNRFSELTVRTGADFPWWPWSDDDWTVASVRWSSSSELSWGAHAGLGVYFGSKRKWSAQFALTYLDATYELERESDSTTASVSLDPLMFGFGFGFRF